MPSRGIKPFQAVAIKQRRQEEIRRLKRELETVRQERDMLKKVLHIKTLCQALGVSNSGYYAWKRRPSSRRQQADEALAERIRQIHQASRRIRAELDEHRDFSALAPNTKWVTDITGVWTSEG